MPSFCERVSCSAEKVKEKKQKPLRSKGRTSCRTFCYFLVQRDDQHNFSSSITNSNSRKKKRHGKVRNRFSFYANAKEGGVCFFWTNPASKKQLSITSLDKKLPYLRRKPNSFNSIYTYTLLEEKKRESQEIRLSSFSYFLPLSLEGAEIQVVFDGRRFQVAGETASTVSSLVRNAMK